MATAEVTIWVEREGLLLHLWLGGFKESRRHVSTINLQEKLKLSDDRASELLALLNEQAERRTEEA